MTITTFLVTWELKSSTEATRATSTTADKLKTTTTATDAKVVCNFFDSVWIKVAIGVIVLASLIVLIVILSKTCKKQGKYEVEK